MRLRAASAVHLTTMAGVTVLYLAAAKVGLLFAAISPSATAVWPPAGIAFAACLVLGYRVWPAIFLGAFLANITTAGSVGTSFAIAAGNTLEALAGAALVTRWANGPKVFDRARDIFAFVGLAALASTTVSATIGVTSLALGGYVQWADYGPVWLTWWLGDATGELIFSPLLVLWARTRSQPWGRDQVVEAALLLCSLLVVGGGVFGRASPLGLFPLSFLCIPPLLWAAFRFGPRDTATATVLMSAIAVWGHFRILGSLSTELRNSALLLLQVFMATMSVTAVSVAALAWDRKRADEAHSRLAAIVESSDDAIVSKTVDGVITTWNRAAERIFGWTAVEAVGRPIKLIIPEDRHTEEDAVLARIRRGEIVDHFETVRITKDGRLRNISLTVSPIRDGRRPHRGRLQDRSRYHRAQAHRGGANGAAGRGAAGAGAAAYGRRHDVRSGDPLQP